MLSSYLTGYFSLAISTSNCPGSLAAISAATSKITSSRLRPPELPVFACTQQFAKVSYKRIEVMQFVGRPNQLNSKHFFSSF